LQAKPKIKRRKSLRLYQRSPPKGDRDAAAKRRMRIRFKVTQVKQRGEAAYGEGTKSPDSGILEEGSRSRDDVGKKIEDPRNLRFSREKPEKDVQKTNDEA